MRSFRPRRHAARARSPELCRRRAVAASAKFRLDLGRYLNQLVVGVLGPGLHPLEKVLPDFCYAMRIPDLQWDGTAPGLRRGAITAQRRAIQNRLKMLLV
jgi:hypothetical protein